MIPLADADPAKTSTLESAATRLSKLSRDQAYKAYELFDWPDALPLDRYWFTPELMSCYGTPIWDGLTEDERLRLSHAEAVNFFSLNVHLIRDLIGEVAGRIYSSRYPGLSEFFHDFIAEENEHMWFFATFCLRYGGGIYPPRGSFVTSRHPLPAAQDLLVFGRILIAEELCDAFNAPMGVDERLPRIVQEINLVHHRDESRHIAFGRQLVRSLVDELKATGTPEDLEFVGAYLDRYKALCLGMLYNPSAYRESGIGALRSARRQLMSAPARLEAHRRLMDKTERFFSRLGLSGPSPSPSATPGS